MARPIRETPILYGDDARRFEERMKNPPKESKEQFEDRMNCFKAFMNAFLY